MAGRVEGVFVWGCVAQGGDEHGPHRHFFCLAYLAGWRLERIRMRRWASFFVIVIFLHGFFYFI